MPTIKKFEDLEIWKLAREQAKEIYNLTTNKSFARNFDLRDQMNASDGSTMDNIAEGFERFTNKDFCHFLVISKGSNAEVRSQLYRAFDRNHISGVTLESRLEFSVMLGNKIKSLADYLSSSQYKNKARRVGQLPTFNLQLPTSNIKPQI